MSLTEFELKDLARNVVFMIADAGLIAIKRHAEFNHIDLTQFDVTIVVKPKPEYAALDCGVTVKYGGE